MRKPIQALKIALAYKLPIITTKAVSKRINGGKDMKFTLHVSIQNPKKHTKEEIMQAVADYCNRNGYKFDVGFYPAEIDLDAIGKA